MSIRDRIKEEMQTQGLSQQKLADMTGIPRPNLSRFLSGQCDMLSDNVQRVMTALGLKVEESKNAKSDRNVAPVRATPKR